MLLYEFKCPECGHGWDERRPIEGDTTSAACPRCGAAAHRRFSLAGHFNEAAGFKEDFYVAFGRHIKSKREFKEALAEAKRANEVMEYEEMDIDTGESTGDVVETYRPCELEANLL